MAALQQDESSGDAVAKGSVGSTPLELPGCTGLPREMLESGLSEHVFARMDFLWRASHCLRVSSPSASRVYSDQLLKYCAEHASETTGWVGLPECVADSMCSKCGSVFAPGINCRVRVRHRSLASPGAKSKKRKKEVSTATAGSAATAAAPGKKGPRKYRNEVVVTCFLCGRVSTQGGTERRAHHRRRQRRNGSGGGGPEAAVAAAPGRTGRSRVAANLRGNFIPMGDSSPSFSRGTAALPSTASSSSKKKRGKLVGPTRRSSSNAGGSRGQGGTAGSGGGSGGGSGFGGGRGGDGGNRDASGGGREFPRNFLPVPPAARGGSSVAETGRSNSSYAGRSDYGAAGGCDGASQAAAASLKGADSATVPREPPSLLEKIRKDAKRKRRQKTAAAGAVATAAATSGAGAGGGMGDSKK